MTAFVSRRLFAALSAMAILTLIAAPAWAADPVYSDWLGKAIKGYDPVAYFTEGLSLIHI